MIGFFLSEILLLNLKIVHLSISIRFDNLLKFRYMDKLRPYNYICFFIALLFSQSFIYGQNWNIIDSLKKINLKETDSTQIVENYYEIASNFRNYDVDSSLLYSHKGLSISDRINDIAGSAKLHYNIAHCYYRTSQYKLSLYNFSKAASLFDNAADSIYLMKCYNNIGALFSFGNSQPLSLEYYLKSLKIAEALHDTIGLANCYNNIGYLYQRIKEYAKAEDYFRKTLMFDKISGEKSYISLSHANLGFVLIKQNKKEKAQKHFHTSINLFQYIKDPCFLAEMYLSASGFYFYINQLDSAKIFIDKSQSICRKNDFPHIQANIYSCLGKYYMIKKMYNQSVYWYDKSLDLSISKDITESLPKIYLNKSKVYAHLTQYKQAYEALRLANSTRDSLEYGRVAVMIKEYEKERQKQNELHREHLEYELINQKSENANIKMKMQFQTAMLLVVLFGVILLVASIFMLIVRRNNRLLREKNLLIIKQKNLLEENLSKLEVKEKKLRELIATKDRFFSIIAHDLRSPFNSILGFSSIMEESIKSKDYDDIGEYSNIIHQASQKTIDLIDNLIGWSRSQTNGIKFKPESIELVGLINDVVGLVNFSAKQKLITISLKLPDKATLFGDKSMFRTMIRNLISNAIKFTNRGGEILVSVKKVEKYYHISVSDNGVGIKKEVVDKLFKIEENVSTTGTENESGTGLGLILCREFAKKHNGNIKVKSELGVGSTFTVILPIRYSAD